ncbi:MAG: polysaccharide deacetylase family protein [Gaiellaceae bacterium]
MPPASVERRARWVLDTVGAGQLGFGDDVPYKEGAWEQVDRGERPQGDTLAEAFFHLARVEERSGSRDQHGRFPGSASCLDPLDPPLERLRSTLRLDSRPWGGARFAVALTMDVDVPWRWTRRGILGSLVRLKGAALHARGRPAARELRALAALPWHKLRGSDPYWRFESIMREERRLGVRSTFFLLAAHRHPADGPSPEAYDRLRARLVETLRRGGAEIGLHGSYTAADDEEQLASEAQALHALAGELDGHRFHYLRVDPHRNLRPLDRLGFHYDTSLGFADRYGFRAGIAQPFRPWDFAAERPLDLIEIPLAVMDATLAEERYLGLSAAEAEQRLNVLLDWAAGNGGAFSVVWHPDRFDPAQARGWDRLYYRFIAAVKERGGACVTCEDLAAEAASRLPPGAVYSAQSHQR